ncbi:MAG: hypothetical protein HYZ51_01295 [Candidatus Doudnabacteria bacterium]|nr:hypothetical protein [Candidatus Doudnabacteria bacterium]
MAIASPSNDKDPKAFSSVNQTDVTKSLSPFVIIFDQEGKVVAGTAVLDKQAPVPPKSVFDVAKLKGDNRLTWQPRKGVRLAVIIKPYSSKDANGFVLVGKSLKEVESRIENLFKLTALAWAIFVVLSLVAVNLIFGKKEEHHQSANA